jgi:hypothetical protein
MTDTPDIEALRERVIEAADAFERNRASSDPKWITALWDATTKHRAATAPASRCEPPEWAKGEEWHWLEHSSTFEPWRRNHDGRWYRGHIDAPLLTPEYMAETGWSWHSVAKPESLGWKCGARNTSSEPQDCDWPFCSCDPAANKVMAAIEESGFSIVRSDAVATPATPLVEPTDDEIDCVISTVPPIFKDGFMYADARGIARAIIAKVTGK